MKLPRIGECAAEVEDHTVENRTSEVGILCLPLWESPGKLVNGAIVVASWSSGRPLIVCGVVKGRNRVDVNLYAPSSDAIFYSWKGDGAIILRNALLYQ